MDKKKVTRMTLDDIIKAKLQKDQDKLTVQDMEIPSVGKALRFRRPTRSEICDLIDRISESEGQTEEMLEIFEGLIYACCDDLHSQDLFDQLELENPEEIVQAIMDEGDILVVGDEVASMNPLYHQFEEDEKNSSSMTTT